jgi:hypothetical protein
MGVLQVQVQWAAPSVIFLIRINFTGKKGAVQVISKKVRTKAKCCQGTAKQVLKNAHDAFRTSVA